MVRHLLAGGLLPATSRPAAGCLPLPIASGCLPLPIASADSSLSARHLRRCLEAEEWLRQVCHGGCPCVSSLYARAVCVCTCVRACLPVCVCVRVRAKDMIDATGASQRRHLLDCESGCVATAGIDGEGMLLRVRVAVWAPACCVQWTSYVVLSSVLSSVLRPRHAVAPRAPRHFKAPATTQLLPAPQASPHGAAGEPRKNPRYCARQNP